MASIRVKPGDPVRVQERDQEWPAFVRVTTLDGGSGWVPARYLSATDSNATVLFGYDTRELVGKRGEVLTVVERDDESGWLWCRRESGEEGWLPSRSVESIS